MTQTAIPCTVMRGGTSKGLYFRADDLPADVATRDAVLLAAMGSPDARQIDGMGGAHPLTSKVAVVAPPSRSGRRRRLPVPAGGGGRGRASTTARTAATCWPASAPSRSRRAWSPAQDGVTDVRIYMRQHQQPGGGARSRRPAACVRYDGDARIDGVPGTAAPIPIDFLDVAGSSCGALLPTGNARDVVDGIELTCIDNGMPVVVMRAADFGKTGYETPEELEADAELKARVEAIRLEVGPLMNLGDVAKKTVPEDVPASRPPQHGGAICTRTFIPHRVHEAIGVFGAVSVATACVMPGSVAAEVAGIAEVTAVELEVEHPTGFFTVAMDVVDDGDQVTVRRAALLRTARLLMRGEVYVPRAVWGGPMTASPGRADRPGRGRPDARRGPAGAGVAEIAAWDIDVRRSRQQRQPGARRNAGPRPRQRGRTPCDGAELVISAVTAAPDAGGRRVGRGRAGGRRLVPRPQLGSPGARSRPRPT